MTLNSMGMNAPRIFAAFDIGSNGVRLFVGRLYRGNVQILKDRRESIRLGEDSFRYKEISAASIQKLIHCFREFRREAEQLGALHWRAVATSAVRDARNGRDVVRQVWQQTGVHIEIIGGLEEAELLHLAVRKSLPLNDQKALLIDIGGGSLETVIAQGSRIQSALSLRLGTVRLLQRCGVDASFAEYSAAVRKELSLLIDSCDPYADLIRPELLVGIGGNLKALNRLSARISHRAQRSSLNIHELEHLCEVLFSMSVRQREQKLGLKKDRADVIRPAIVCVLNIMRTFNFEHLKVPNVGIKNGLFWRLAATVSHQKESRTSGRQTFVDFPHYRNAPGL